MFFANEIEAICLGQNWGLGDDISQIALNLTTFSCVSSSSRVVVFTQGPGPVLLAHNGIVTSFDVPPIDFGLIKDTTGAGDAFVGGFLAEIG